MQNMPRVVSTRLMAKYSFGIHFNAVRLYESPSGPFLGDEKIRFPPIKPKYPPGQWGSVPPKHAWEMYNAELGRANAAKAAALKKDAEDEEVKYPPVKPKYPPGIWGSVPPKRAWEMYETREVLLSKETAKLRLEELAGPYPHINLNKHKQSTVNKTNPKKDIGGLLEMWIMKSVDLQPGLVPYKKHLTKTHVVRQLPDNYSGDNVDQSMLERIKPIVKNALLMHNEYYQAYDAGLRTGYKIERQAYQIQYLLGNILDALINNLCFEVPHLQDAQVILKRNLC